MEWPKQNISTHFNYIIHMCEGGTKKLLHVFAGHQTICENGQRNECVCEYVCMCVLVGGGRTKELIHMCRGTKNEYVYVCVWGGGGGGAKEELMCVCVGGTNELMCVCVGGTNKCVREGKG